MTPVSVNTYVILGYKTVVLTLLIDPESIVTVEPWIQSTEFDKPSRRRGSYTSELFYRFPENPFITLLVMVYIKDILNLPE